MKISEE